MFLSFITYLKNFGIKYILDDYHIFVFLSGTSCFVQFPTKQPVKDNLMTF